MPSNGVVCALLVAAFLGVSQGQLKAACKIEQLRACGSDYLPYGTRETLEVGGEKFKEACVRDNQQIKCTLNFVEECLEGLPRVAAQLAIKALEDSYEATCTEGTEQNKLYKNGVACMNAAGPKLHSCMSILGDKLQRGTSKAPKKEVIHYSCCSYHDALQCVEDALVNCDTEDGKEFMTGSMENIFGETLSLVCGQYSRGSSACKQLPELPQLGADEPRITNVIEQAIQVASSLGN